MRGLQRDALVAYILHQMRSKPAKAHIDTPDKLFEYFLMDVQMEPCMQTSRIRHALSSVQLFIERCLMNLEPRVSPEALNAQTVGVDEALPRLGGEPQGVPVSRRTGWSPSCATTNRRSSKSSKASCCRATSPRTRRSIALLNYLDKLEESPSFEPCGIHHVDADPAREPGTIDHVIAATPGRRRKYFYRRREYGYWTPWEQIKLDIEGNPVIPVVWNDRLLLFWLQIMKEAPPSFVRSPGRRQGSDRSDNGPTCPRDPAVTTQAILGWSEYYNGKWQSPKTSEVDLPSDIHSSSTAFIRRNLDAWSVLRRAAGVAQSVDPLSRICERPRSSCTTPTAHRSA